jgi:hypothetical protein
VSSSEHNSNSHERALNAAIAEYYRQVEGGVGVDREAFVGEYPGLESELSDFLSNIGLFDVGGFREESRQSPLACRGLCSTLRRNVGKCRKLLGFRPLPLGESGC